MSARRNYGFERRRREDVRRAKQEEKRQRRAERAASGAVGPEMGEAQDTGARPDVWQWFSASRGRTVSSPAGARPPSDPPDDWILLTDVDEGEAEGEAKDAGPDGAGPGATGSA